MEDMENEKVVSFSELETSEFKFVMDNFDDVEIVVTADTREAAMQKFAQFIDIISEGDTYETPE